LACWRDQVSIFKASVLEVLDIQKVEPAAGGEA
jgi:hypothetical protein